ncbi:MAG TPA: protein kinase [Polyangiaceae bacterium]|nr:protein kinase [Polyangiaceae bacterium]
MTSETPGRTLGGRFRIEREVGRGGAGVVYRAVDQETNEAVALKVVSGEAGVSPQEEARLAREGDVLRSLSHPGIVRVVASGVLDDTGQPFLAMEWLEGEDLAARQARAPLTFAQCIELGVFVAQALEAAHDRGVVHRDVKPSNIFLCSESLGGAEYLDVHPKLVDFGVATSDDIRVTRSGDLVGTPAYMAPEQARGDAPIDARCDIYSLGATLFELLTSRPPHVGPTPIATLARLVTTTPPRLRELRRNVPPLLDNLIHRMLASDVMDRPGSAQEVAETLQMLLRQSTSPSSLELAEPVMSSRLGSSASRLVTSIVAIGFSSTSARDRALEMLRQRDADAVPLGHDSIVAHLGARFAVGTEASVAVELGRRLAKGGASVGVASGRARVNQSTPTGEVQPIGEVVDRASSLARDAGRGTVLADATTSELGRGRYEFRSRDDGSAIVGEPLRGQRGDRMGGAPFVGRDAELAQVTSAFERAAGDHTPILVSITGPPGIGKTRLRREVLARISARADAPRVILQRSEAYGKSQALGAATDVVRSLLNLPKGSSVPEAEAAIVEQLGPATRSEVTSQNRKVVARLLADEALPGGGDLSGMRDLLWLAVTDLVLQVIGSAPTAVVVEDLQWADPESVGWLDHLIGRASTRPILVLAMMRPSFWVDHAGRFTGRDHVRLELRPISKRASRTIAKSYLGEETTDAILDRIVEQAAGLPLFAEELSRLAAAGGDTEHAATIEAAIQASLDTLDVESRDAIGRLSVFGFTAWDAGLEALGMSNAESRLRDLAGAEILVEQSSSRFSGSREWLFKHSLFRDVIYASLGELERKKLHALAADWLASMGEDASVVAGHYDLGGQQHKAAFHWARAAQRALATNALADALTMAERALSFAEDKQAGFQRASYLDEAWSRLDPRASDRMTAIEALEENVYDEATAVRARGARARYEDARGIGEDVSERLASTRDEAAELGMHEEVARCSAALATRLAFAGQFEEAEAEANGLLLLADRERVLSAAVDAWQTLAIIRQTRGEPSAALEARRSAVQAARLAGLREREATLTCNLGFALTTIGARQEARASLDRGLELADSIGSSGAVRHAQMNLLGWASVFGNDRKLEVALGEVRSNADAAATGMWTAPDRSNLGMLFYRGAELLRAESQGAADRARSLLRMAAESYRSTGNRDVLPVSLGMWALAERRLGNSERAHELASEAADLLESGAPSLLNEAAVYLALHAACKDRGLDAEARNAVERSIPRLLRRVRGLIGTPYARLFLTEPPHNAELVATAEAYGLIPDAIHQVLEKGAS